MPLKHDTIPRAYGFLIVVAMLIFGWLVGVA